MKELQASLVEPVDVQVLSGSINIGSGVIDNTTTAPDTIKAPGLVTCRGGITFCSGTQLPSNAVKSVAVRSMGTHSGSIVWLGDGTASNPCSGTGMPLCSGEVITVDINNMDKIYVWACTSGTQVALLGVDKA